MNTIKTKIKTNMITPDIKKIMHKLNLDIGGGVTP